MFTVNRFFVGSGGETKHEGIPIPIIRTRVLTETANLNKCVIQVFYLKLLEMCAQDDCSCRINVLSYQCTQNSQWRGLLSGAVV